MEPKVFAEVCGQDNKWSKVMGLLFAWTLMGLPLVYAIWSLIQNENDAQLANHTRTEPNVGRFQAPHHDEQSMLSGTSRLASSSSPLAPRPSGSFIEQLAALQTRLIDVLAGYKTMRENAEPEIQPIVSDYIDLHSRHEQQLAERLVETGHKADEDGSFFSIIQESVVRVRSMLTELGTNTFPQIIEGENTLINLYKKTLGKANLETDQMLLDRQVSELTDLIRRTESLTT